MSDIPPSYPFDEHASELLDTGAPAPADDAALAARVDELRGLRAALADVPPPDPARREQSVAAALAAFSLADDLAPHEVATDDPTPLAKPAPVVRLAARRSSPTRWLTLAAAAVVGVALVGGGMLASRQSNGGEKPTAAGGVLTSGADTKAADSEASRTAAAPAAGAAGAATTAAATSASTAAVAAIAQAPTPTTIAAAAGTTAKASGPSTAAPAAPPLSVTLQYVGDVGSVAELDAFGAKLAGTNTTVAASEAPGQGGATVRKALADTPCPVDALGAPVALMRWQGRPAVLVSDSVTLRVIGLGDCAVLVARPLGG